MRLKDYAQVDSLKEADELLHKSRNNIILGGLLWLKMGDKEYNVGIDISKLGLDHIAAKDESIEIGSQVTLRQLEKDPLCAQYFNGALKKGVENIVGVQFRNLATIGGSIYSRFGFSEISTILLALNAQVELYRGGIIPMESFIDSPRKKDLLLKIIIPKDKRRLSYQCFRKSETDFPVLSVAVSRLGDDWKIAVGARPSRAKLAHQATKFLKENCQEEDIENCVIHVKEELSFGTNMRGSKEYRQHLAQVLIKKGVIELCR